MTTEEGACMMERETGNMSIREGKGQALDGSDGDRWGGEDGMEGDWADKG